MLQTAVDSKLYGPMLEMITNALEWAQNDSERLKALTPYYPDPLELHFSLQRLNSVKDKNSKEFYIESEIHLNNWSSNTPICCSLGGETIRRSPVLQAIRFWVLQQENDSNPF